MGTPPFLNGASAPAQAARFRRPASKRGRRPAGTLRGRGAGERVLVSDVDKHLVYVLKSELEDDGHVVDVVPPAKAGAAAVEDPSYGVIIFGMPIPCLDFFNRLRMIRLERPSAYLIVFSDNAPNQDRTLLTAAGADAFFAGHEIDLLKAHLRRRNGLERKPPK